MRVPSPSAAGLTADFCPPSTLMVQACGSLVWRVVMVRCATAPIDGKASPRKPSVRMSRRSSAGSFEVACRSTASVRSALLMPLPSSLIRMRRRPPPSIAVSMRLAPASIAFSISSLTTLAGRSITSPAAIRLTVASESWRTGIGSSLKRIGAKWFASLPEWQRAFSWTAAAPLSLCVIFARDFDFDGRRLEGFRYRLLEFLEAARQEVELAFLCVGQEFGIFDHDHDCAANGVEPVAWNVGRHCDRMSHLVGAEKQIQHVSLFGRLRKIIDGAHLRPFGNRTTNVAGDDRNLAIADPIGVRRFEKFPRHQRAVGFATLDRQRGL